MRRETSWDLLGHLEIGMKNEVYRYIDDQRKSDKIASNIVTLILTAYYGLASSNGWISIDIVMATGNERYDNYLPMPTIQKIQTHFVDKVQTSSIQMNRTIWKIKYEICLEKYISGDLR